MTPAVLLAAAGLLALIAAAHRAIVLVARTFDELRAGDDIGRGLL